MRMGLFIGLLAAAGLTSAIAADDGFTLKGAPKIAILYFDAKNDGGWTQSMNEARESMEKQLGQQIAYVEKIQKLLRSSFPLLINLSSAATTSSSGTATAIPTRLRNWPANIPISPF
jgi:basic membrane protein A